MDEMGLAQATAQGKQPQGNTMQAISEIVALLQQGMTPEELIEAGIPEELVRAAMEMLTKQTTQIPPEQAGLAGSVMRQG